MYYECIRVPVIAMVHESTLETIRTVAEHDDGFGLYSMDVRYGYDLDRIVSRGITDDQSAVDAIVEEVLPGSGFSIRAPSFGCTALSLGSLTGRNYDFFRNTSAMMVRCRPEDGYASIGFAALDNISANSMSSDRDRIASLASPFVCLDGMNEKGLTISILTLDSAPVDQRTGRDRISTSLAIRMVLDRCATTEEAVRLLSSYDMHAVGGRDYHFYVTDRRGDSMAVEYDCDREDRPLVSTPTGVMTNFFVMHKDLYGTERRYGHGKDRYDRVAEMLGSRSGGADLAWDALRAAAQEPRPGDATSNTQWSVVYDSGSLSARFVQRRRWSEAFDVRLSGGTPERVRSIRLYPSHSGPGVPVRSADAIGALRPIGVRSEHGRVRQDGRIAIDLDHRVLHPDAEVAEGAVGHVGEVLLPGLAHAAHMGVGLLRRDEPAHRTHVGVDHGLAVPRLLVQHLQSVRCEGRGVDAGHIDIAQLREQGRLLHIRHPPSPIPQKAMAVSTR